MSFGLESPLDERKLRKSSEGKLEDHQCQRNNGNQKGQKDEKEGINQIDLRNVEDGESESREVKQENIQTGLHEEPLDNKVVACTSSLPENPHSDSPNSFSEAAPQQQQPGLCQTDLPVMSSAELTQDWLPEHTEHKRLSWMKECISWNKLSFHNKRKRGPSFQRCRGPQKAAEATGLQPLPPQSLLRSTGVKSLTEVQTLCLWFKPSVIPVFNTRWQNASFSISRTPRVKFFTTIMSGHQTCNLRLIFTHVFMY